MATEYFNDAWRIPNNKNQSLVSNYSMEFDGSGNDSITIPSYTIPENSTVSFWVKSSLTNPQDIIISGVAGHYYPYFLLSGGNIRLIIKAGSVSNEIISDVAWVADTWFHIAITGENGQGAGSTATYYINGVSKGTSLHRAPTLTVIGDYVTASLAWNGQIDQVCFFDYALPATGTNSIATLYGGGTAVTNPMSLSPAPVAYYQLGDQSVSTGPSSDYLVPNNSLQDYVFNIQPSKKINTTLTPPIGANNRTISVWFKTGVNAFKNICGYGTAATSQGFDICTHPSPAPYSIGVHAYGPAIIANGVYIPNQWNHYVVTYDGTVLRGYLNGQPVNTSTIALNTGTSVDFTIGGGAYTPANGFSGDVSNIAIWDSVLTASNVSTIYNNGAPNDISLLSPNNWYKLNAQDTFDGTNWTIKDYAGSNDGTSSGMTSANLVQSNLQHTSGYSPYALSFDSNNANQLVLNNGNGNGLLNAATSFTISAWINPTQPTANATIFAHWGGGILIRYASNGTCQMYVTKSDGGVTLINSLPFKITFNGDWQNFVATYDGSEIKMYINNALIRTPTAFTSALFDDTTSTQDIIGGRGTEYFNGKMSNVAIWKNSVINVTTLYNQGVPGDLTSLNPSGWWQMGSNSSFDASTSKWTCLNEGTARTSAIPSNATTLTGNMTNDAITNGVGYSANGLGESTIEIVGDAPYSTANGISENMDVLDRTTDVPPTV